MKHRLTVGLNLLHAQPEIGGGWNYIENLVQGIGRFDHETRYICYVTEKSHVIVPRQANFDQRHIRIDPASRMTRVAYENIVLPFQAKRDGVQIMHWFANSQSIFSFTRNCVTVHDLLVFKDDHAFGAAQRAYMRAWIRRTAHDKTTLLLPVSKFSAQDLERLLGVDARRMRVIYAVLPEEFCPQSQSRVQAFRAKFQLPERYWLYVAQTYPHKNHLRLLEAYARYRRDNADAWPLLLRGNIRPQSPVATQIDALGLREHVRILPRLDNEDMPLLFAAAGALVFPSLFEGGGIPVLEAIACGCPVAASDLPSLREYADDTIRYFNPESSAEIAGEMTSLHKNEHLRAESVRRGLSRCEDFRAKVVACTMIEIYRKLGQ